MREKKGYVYVLAARGRLKVGYTAWPIGRRMNEVLTSGVRLVGYVRGTSQNERSLHRYLAPDACDENSRTWYRSTRRVRSIVKDVLSTSFRWDRCRLLIEADARYNETSIKPEFRYQMLSRPRFPTPISDALRSNLLLIAKAYAKARKISLNHASKEIYGHIHFLKMFSQGKQSVSLLKYDQMLDKLRGEWPETAVWPILQVVYMRPPPSR